MKKKLSIGILAVVLSLAMVGGLVVGASSAVAVNPSVDVDNSNPSVDVDNSNPSVDVDNSNPSVDVDNSTETKPAEGTKPEDKPAEGTKPEDKPAEDTKPETNEKPSDSAAGTINSVAVNVTSKVNGQDVTMTVQDIKSAFESLAKAQKTVIEKLLEALSKDAATMLQTQKQLAKDVAKANISKVNYSNLVDISLPAGMTMPADGIDITIQDANIKLGDKVFVFHLKEDGQWEYLPSTVQNGAVIAHFNSLSPVYYMTVTEASSKTGENNVMFAFAMATMLAAAVLSSTLVIKACKSK